MAAGSPSPSPRRSFQPLSLAPQALCILGCQGLPCCPAGADVPCPSGLCALSCPLSISQTPPKSLLASPRPASVCWSPFQSFLALLSPLFPAGCFCLLCPWPSGHVPSCTLGCQLSCCPTAARRAAADHPGKRKGWALPGQERAQLASSPGGQARTSSSLASVLPSRQPQEGLFLECGASQAWHEAWAAASFLQDCLQAWGRDPVFCLAAGLPSSL